MSDEYTTTEGLPQGSPLSVGLWRVYVSDFPVEDTNCQAFMDDIIFWASGNSQIEAMNALKEKANLVEAWLNENQMKLNERKSKLIVNKLSDEHQFLRLQGCCYFPKSKLRYLGVNIISHENGPDLALDLSEIEPDLKRRCSLLSKASK